MYPSDAKPRIVAGIYICILQDGEYILLSTHLPTSQISRGKLYKIKLEPTDLTIWLAGAKSCRANEDLSTGQCGE